MIRLDFYIHDYLLKKGYKDSAASFLQEASIHQEVVPIDCPGGFLLEWWLIFWDIFNAKNNNQFASMDAKYYMMYHAKQRQMNYRMKAQRQQQIMQQYASNASNGNDLDKRSNSVGSPDDVHSPVSNRNFLTLFLMNFRKCTIRISCNQQHVSKSKYRISTSNSFEP